jgi:serine protease inhibitor
MDSNIDNLYNELNKKKKKETVLLIIVILLVVGIIGAGVYFYMNKDRNNNNIEIDANDEANYTSEYRMADNDIGEFDLAFLKLENNGENKIYSPLSIKYTLAMLNEGTDGDSNKQIKAVIGDYKSKKYTNSNNLSLANALFVRDSYKDTIKQEYIDTLLSKYNADVIYDSFASNEVMNKWVKDKTLGLIDNLVDNPSELDFVMANALAIDMEWTNQIRAVDRDYRVSFKHEHYGMYLSS